MTTIYEGMTDLELDAEIADLTAAHRRNLKGGEVEEVRGEGRGLRYTRANANELRRELNAALRERQRRRGDDEPGNALAVEFLP